jgi:ABC-type multidrug transport system permease subunit
MIGNALGSISPTKEIGMIFSNILIILFTTLSGFLIRRPELPSWWGWTVWINPYAYYLAAVLRNAVVGKTFTCSPEELGTFALPTGVSSCADVPGAPGGSGYAVSDIATDVCSFCPIPDGATLLESYSATISKWWAVVAILVWILACRVVAGIGFGRLRYITR